MLESLFTSQSSDNAGTQRILTYVKNERMGGYVPKYEIVKIPETSLSDNIEDSLAGSLGADTLAYSSLQQGVNAEQQFGFADLVDMVNPLHHVPVVGHVYRELTGDEIKPISRIMGGAAFGGPLGVATALIDTVMIEETGENMANNAFDLAFGRDTPEYEDTQIAKAQDPEKALEKAIETVNDYEMTSALLAYGDLGKQDEKILKYEAYKSVENIMESVPEREPITNVSFAEKGGLYAL